MSIFVVRIWPRAKSEAFSLVEIVLALGIISFAIVGIMALFPAAMKSALESQRETRATLIARQMISDIKSLNGTNAFVANTKNVLDPGTKIDLSSDWTVTINYDGGGIPVGTAQEALYTAELSVSADQPEPGLAWLQIAIRPTAASTNFPPYTFVTLVDQN